MGAVASMVTERVVKLAMAPDPVLAGAWGALARRRWRQPDSRPAPPWQSWHARRYPVFPAGVTAVIAGDARRLSHPLPDQGSDSPTGGETGGPSRGD